jgi:hypothetical protein
VINCQQQQNTHWSDRQNGYHPTNVSKDYLFCTGLHLVLEDETKGHDRWHNAGAPETMRRKISKTNEVCKK